MKLVPSLPHRGFTLLELLVVIAVIGLLTSIVLMSLNSARDKGADAASRSNLNNIRSQTELYYHDNGLSYEGVCGQDNVSRAVNEAGAVCADSTSTWAAAVDLLTTDVSYCVDSTGVSYESEATAADEVANGICDGAGGGGSEEEEEEEGGDGGWPPMASPTVRYIGEIAPIS